LFVRLGVYVFHVKEWTFIKNELVPKFKVMTMAVLNAASQNVSRSKN